ncbi:MAG TPA: FAD-dependent oxidoreductase [Vicinamibacterales bacterium]
MPLSTSPCNLDCPAGTDVRRLLTLTSQGDAAGAWRTILERNPFPGVCGRVCYRPCEAGCNRAGVDEGLAVQAIERAVAAEAARLNVTSDIVNRAARATGRRIAVIGSGPAGLSCAFHLALAGHSPVIFEAADEPGGMLRYAIPAYRLPREILFDEIDLLKRLGVEIRTSHRFGTDLSWSNVFTFDAVFLAVGNQRPRTLGIPGEKLRAVRPAIEFLREVNAGGGARVGGRVAVIGGDNAALDVARIAVRDGAKVTVIYRRSREEMRAHPDEIAQAEAEGVQFVFQATALRFQGWRGVLKSVHCQRTRAGAADATGRSTPEPIAGATFTLSCNDAFIAAGQDLDRSSLGSVIEIANGRIKADRHGRCAKVLVFAGGEAVLGPCSIAEAIGSGRRAAEAIDAVIRGWAPGLESASGTRVAQDDLNLASIIHAPRVHLPLLHKSYAVAGYREVAGPIAWSEAVAEAQRCLQCGA